MESTVENHYNSDGVMLSDSTSPSKESPTTKPDDNIPLRKESWRNIFKELFFNVVPNSLTISFGYFSGLIVLLANLAFIGRHSNATVLAAVGLGNVWINFVGINIVFGLNYGFETIASRVWGGGNHYKMGQYLKKTMIMNLMTMVLCFFMLVYTKEILVLMGQDEEISVLCYKYVIAMFPGSFCLAFYDLLLMFLTSQNIFRPAMYIQIVTTIFHIIFCYLFVDVFQWSILGIAYAMNITQALNLVLILLYLKFLWPEKKTFDWGPKLCSRKIVYSEWSKFLSIVVPISLTVILEYSSYEINSVIAGLLKSSVTLAAHVSLTNTGSVIYCIPEGFSTAITTFVGNAVGENKKHKAQKFALLGNISGFFVLLLVIFLLVLFQGYWPSYFSEDEAVGRKIRDLMTLFAVMNIFDTLQMNMSAVLKALGKQNLTLFIYFICLYVIGNPSSYLFGLTCDGDLEGIWHGIILGEFCMVVWFSVVLMRLNWDKEIFNCRVLEEEDHVSLETESQMKHEGEGVKSLFVI